MIKILFFVAGLLVLSFVAAFLWGFWKAWRDRRKAAPDGYAPPVKAYLGLRGQIFDGTLQRELVPSDFPAEEPWSVVMDWGVGRAIATIVAFSDGTASMYYSSGGGNLGGGQVDPNIRDAAKNALAVAAKHLNQLKPVSDFPIPTQQGQVFFYVLTLSGTYFGEGFQKELGTHQHPLSELGNAMQAIVTGYRLHRPKRK
jgi:hypothetical protein